VTSDRSRTSLETEYPHLSVVHLFKEPLHQQRRGAHYTELKTLSSFAKIYFNHSPNLMPEQHYRTGKPATSSPPRPTSGALQQERPHYKELSEGVKRIDKENLETPCHRNDRSSDNTTSETMALPTAEKQTLLTIGCNCVAACPRTM
jgi:hypothetical protein